MSGFSTLEQILGKVKEEEEMYEWLKAVDLYRKALTSVGDSDLFLKAEIQEDLAYAEYKAAFQADNNQEFRNRMERSGNHYKEAKIAYERSADDRKLPRIIRCEAMMAFSGYWIAQDVVSRKTLIDSSWKFTEEALKTFNGFGETLDYGRTFNQLILTLFITANYWDKAQPNDKKVIEYGEQAIRFLSSNGNPHDLSKAYMNTAVMMTLADDPGIREEYDFDQKIVDYRRKACQLSEKDALLALVSVPGIFFMAEVGTEETLTLVQKALNYAKKTRDNYIIGYALDQVAFHNTWKAVVTENPDEKVNLINTALACAESAQESLSKLAHISAGFPLLWPESPYAEYHLIMADCETNIENRRAHLQKGIEAGRERLKKAQDAGYPSAVWTSHHTLSKALLRLAETEKNLDSKRQLLEEALHHEDEGLRQSQAYSPELSYYDQGLYLAQIANIKSKLADLLVGSDTEYKMLQEAIADNEKGIAFHFKEIRRSRLDESATSLFERIGRNQYQHGDLIVRLCRLSHDKNHLEKAVQAFLGAADSFKKLGNTSRMAESHWKAAHISDSLGEYEKAATYFDLASTDFSCATEKIPRLKDFYRDYSGYMQGWAEIERGRDCHRKHEYGLARNHFNKAAELHESSTRWSYLTANYAAWAQLERAEELSREGNGEDARTTFLQVIDLCDSALRSIQAQVGKIKDTDEKQMANTLLNAIQFRKEYCKARISIEEAKMLDNKGEHSSSAKQYGTAVDTLDRLLSRLEDETDRKEIQFTRLISQAWRKMAEAESEESRQHYFEASQLFETAKDSAQNEKTKALVLGHSHLCKALEAGAGFTDTRDMTEHARAMQHLEIATTYYLKADFHSASEYTKATRFLFDAYVHMGHAARETDPEKKTRLYTLAQKLLQASANSYAKANNPSKREQALKLLETANEQREIAYSLAEALNAPILTSTTALTTPTPTSEKATGLEKFEHAEVNANLILSRRELRVGESVDLEIELANAGKGQALLTQIESAVPRGFEVAVKPESYRVEGFNINMKGKRLDPLKAEEVKFSLRSKHKGSFTIGPTIRYVDENGNAKSHQPEPLTITVRELGISGWIKGER